MLAGLFCGFFLGFCNIICCLMMFLVDVLFICLVLICYLRFDFGWFYLVRWIGYVLFVICLLGCFVLVMGCLTCC